MRLNSQRYLTLGEVRVGSGERRGEPPPIRIILLLLSYIAVEGKQNNEFLRKLEIKGISCLEVTYGGSLHSSCTSEAIERVIFATKLRQS